MRILLTVFLAILSIPTYSQEITIDFDDIELPDRAYENGSELNEAFFDFSGVVFPINYDSEFDFWEGFAVSAVTDNQTKGFTNQYSCISGTGYNSSQYAVVSVFNPVTIYFNSTEEKHFHLKDIHLTNNTYTYYSMLEGDQFAKKFGGESGDDPDYLRLKFVGFRDGAALHDTLTYYLADFRFNNNDEDFIINEWEVFDLSDLGQVDSLQILFESTDIGRFGINTPAYFCIDQLRLNLDRTTPTEDLHQDLKIELFPNADYDKLIFNSYYDVVFRLQIVSLSGHLLKEIRVNNHNEIDISNFPKGVFLVKISSQGKQKLYKFSKLK